MKPPRLETCMPTLRVGFWKAIFSDRAALGILFVISGAAFLTSFVLEFYWQVQPCNLCWIQRELYGALSITALGGLLFSFVRLVKTLCLILLLALLITAAYHTLVQFNLISTSCSMHIEAESLESFALQLGSSSNSCSQQNLILFGVPLSFLSFVVSLGMLILFLTSTVQSVSREMTAFFFSRG